MEVVAEGRHNPEMMTVAQLVESFHQHYQVRVATDQSSPKTAAWYRSMLAHLVRTAGPLPAASMRTHNLVGLKLTNGLVRAIKALFAWAVDDELLPKDPLKKLVTPPCGNRQRTLERPEMVRLYRACTSPFRQFLFVLAHTISRPGEVRGLVWRDVNLGQRLITLTEFKGKKRRKDTMAVRQIPLDKPTARMLTAWYARRRPGPNDHVFVSSRTGRPWTGNALRCRMRRARAAAGLDQAGAERVVCYTLRHTGATEATRAGLPDRQLADMMGHSTTQMLKRYVKLKGKDMVDGMDKVREAQRRKAA